MANGFEPGSGQGQEFSRRGLGGFVRCRCPSCGYQIEHRRNIPCNEMTCPKCGRRGMIGN